MIYLYFNSIKVQLEPNDKDENSLFIGFQFHKGTIRTQIAKVTPHPFGDFNSIKVQLEL